MTKINEEFLSIIFPTTPMGCIEYSCLCAMERRLLRKFYSETFQSDRLVLRNGEPCIANV